MVTPMKDAFVTMPAATDQAESDLIEEFPLACIEFDAQGVIVGANSMACLLFEMEREQMVGLTGWDFMAGNEIEMSRESFFSTLQSTHKLDKIRRSLYANKGSFHIYDVYRKRIRDAQGKAIGLRAVFVDITEGQGAHEEALQARLWFENILSSVGEAIIVTDVLGFMRYVNPVAEELTGWKSDELIGQNIEKCIPMAAYIAINEPIFPKRSASLVDSMRLATATANHISLAHRRALSKRTKAIATIFNRQKQELPVEVITSPLMESHNDITLGVITILRRISATSY
jgi:PAS domain S-box-containing protein